MSGASAAVEGRPKDRAPAAAEGEAWKWVRIPAALHEQYKVLAGQEQRSIAGQIIWVLQDALRREREHKRRRDDGAPGEEGAGRRRARGVA